MPDTSDYTTISVRAPHPVIQELDICAAMRRQDREETIMDIVTTGLILLRQCAPEPVKPAAAQPLHPHQDREEIYARALLLKQRARYVRDQSHPRHP